MPRCSPAGRSRPAARPRSNDPDPALRRNSRPPPDSCHEPSGPESCALQPAGPRRPPGSVAGDLTARLAGIAGELAGSLDLAGRTVTMDAMHAQQETARRLLDDCGADYVVTAVRGNQETICEDLMAIDFSGAPWHETIEKGHGRIKRRRCAAIDISGAEWDGFADLHGRRQAVRVERERETLRTGRRSHEVTWCLTSLGAERAGPEDLLELVRRHWTIGNRVHYVRDFTYDEDRCRAHVRQMPRSLASLSSAAIAIVRCEGRFRYIPEANRHYAARTQEALDAVLVPPRSAAPQT